MNSLAKRFFYIALSALLFTVSACSTKPGDDDGENNRYGETIGTAVGVAIGGTAGSRIGGGNGTAIAITLGAVIGMIMGKELGKALDKDLFTRANDVVQGSLENNDDGETTVWDDPDSDDSGTITPQTTVQNDTAGDCRDFESTITVEGKTEVAQGRACREPDGSWKIVN